MKYNPDKHHRRSIRLKEYDYSSPSAYFITICVQNRACLLGRVCDGEMQMNDAGEMVQQVWSELPQRFAHVCLDTFVVMPNHIHGIVILTDFVGAPLVGAQKLNGDAQKTNGDTQKMNGVGTRPTPTGLDAQTFNGDAQKMNGVGTRPTPTGLDEQWMKWGLILGDVVGVFKSITTHQYTVGVKQQNWEPFCKRLWQRNYYEHIIQDEEALQRIREYVKNNPLLWDVDQLHPDIPSKW